MKSYIIAEIGSNFNQSKKLAFKMIKAAKKIGADAVKFQLFNAKKMYPNDDKMYRLFKSIELNPKWIKDLKNYCKKNKIDFLCSVFDLESAKLVNNYVRYHKVASSEATNYDLLKYLLKTKKKILFSTGMCDIKDVENFLNLAKKYKNKDIILMQCGSMYPIPSNHVNLNVLKTYNKYKCQLGFSDHTIGFEAAMCARAIGAEYFEKHFTLNKKLKGPDHFFAAEPLELKNYIKKIALVENLLGKSSKEMLPDEKKFGRRDGIYCLRNIKKGTIIKKEFIYIKRPALGIRSRDINDVIGKKIISNKRKNSPIFKSDFKN